jgi:hypothetical protein
MASETRHAEHFIGVDLGKLQDFTAAAIVTRVERNERTPRREGACLVHADDWVFDGYQLLHLERYPKRTKYQEIAQHIAGLQQRPELEGTSRVIIDRTGVGEAAWELFKGAGVKPLHGVTITGGEEVTGSRSNRKVPKGHLVGAAQVLLQNGHLAWPNALELASTFRDELLDFQVKYTSSGHMRFEHRTGAHDDLVLAVSLACYWAEEGLQRTRHGSFIPL